MGLASKRRGGSGGGPGSVGSRSSKGSASGRVKDKAFKGDDGREDGKLSRGGGKSRIGRRVTTSPTPDASRRRRTIEPSKLARGMSSRLVGARVSQQLSILTPDEIERDLRHMEAYGNACTAYAQQFFIFHNRALVQSGHFGPVSGPGLAGSENYLANGSPVDGYGHQAYPGSYEGGQYGMHRPEHSPRSSNFHMRDGRIVPAMPVRIDPEEEKRVAMLRKRIAASEAQREVLEMEYISLRAHYVNESQKLLGTRDAVDGQLSMLQQLIHKRGKVLALKRVRCAVARDILSCLVRRTQLLASQEDAKKAHEEKTLGDAQAMEGVEIADKVTNGKSRDNEKDLADILDVWNAIENELRDAETECMNIVIPKVSDSSSKTQTSGGGRRSKSPKEEPVMNGGTSKKKQRRGSDDSGEKETSGKRNKDTSAEKKDSKENTEEDGIVPWEGQIMPRTPYGVPVFVSYMSSVPDKAAAFACGGMFGSKKDDMFWLESNVPASFKDMGSEREEMLRLREESQFLMGELEKERETNKELQRQVISGRKRSDEMCAMMTMVRSETEAVLKRHNVLLDTPEARSAAQALHAEASEERDQNESGEDDLQDHGVDQDVLDEDEESPIIGQHRSPHAMSPEDEGEIQEHDDFDDGSVDQLPLSAGNEKRSSSIVAKGLAGDSGKRPENDMDNDGDDEGGLDEDDEEEGEILEDEGQKPPDGEAFYDRDDGNHNNENWVRGKEDVGGSVRGSKRNFSEGDSVEGGDLSQQSGKRRRRL